MSDHHEAPSTGPRRTGNSSVDDVLTSVEALDDLPVDEHVAVFEQAHDRLRTALEAADGDNPGT